MALACLAAAIAIFVIAGRIAVLIDRPDRYVEALPERLGEQVRPLMMSDDGVVTIVLVGACVVGIAAVALVLGAEVTSQGGVVLDKSTGVLLRYKGGFRCHRVEESLPLSECTGVACEKHEGRLWLRLHLGTREVRYLYAILVGGEHWHRTVYEGRWRWRSRRIAAAIAEFLGVSWVETIQDGKDVYVKM